MAGDIVTTKFPKIVEGQRNNRLVAIEFAGYKGNSRAWLFQCDCGTRKVIAAYHVQNGNVKGCGCQRGGSLHVNRLAKLRPALTEARRMGTAQYNTGLPCKRGHHSNRWTSSGDCVECERSRPHSQNRLARGYGLKDWNEVLEIKKTQKNLCRICNNPFGDSKNTHIDHCHKTNKVRGLLCRRCNHGLGFFSDNPEHLRAAALYIESSRPRPKG